MMPLRKIKNPRNFEKCRACEHSYISHTDIAHNPSVCGYVVNGPCRCSEFIPKDNLEFLEYKYGQTQ